MLFNFNGLSIRNQRNVNSDTDIGIQQECAKTMQTEIQMVMSNFVCFLKSIPLEFFGENFGLTNISLL